MDQTGRCVYCMLGFVSDGTCTRCGKSFSEQMPRSVGALPVRYLLKRQYYLGRVLGSGGFGITYIAWDCINNRRVAIKELFPRPEASRMANSFQITVPADKQEYFQHIKKRFCEESQLLYELRTVPETLDVYHRFEENGTAYYAMEYLEGEDLKTYLERNGAMKWTQMINPLCMILRALHALHKKDLIHRDISPANIFILEGGKAKLIDFGSARNYENSEHFTTILNRRYAPYEQFHYYGEQGPYTDIYALSVTLYYALSGQQPPMSTDRIVKTQSGQPDPIIPIERFCPDLPPHVANALKKGMAVRPEQRCQTIAEFAKRLFPAQDVLSAAVHAQVQPSVHSQVQHSIHEQVQNRHLNCVAGVLKGKRQRLRSGIIITIGRGEDCIIQYPSDERGKGISRRQCSLTLDGKGIVYIRDENSRFGTYLNKKRLKPNVWHIVGIGSLIVFAKEAYRLI